MGRFGLAIALVLAIGHVSAQELRVTSGITDHQVFQRGPNNSATVHLTGVATGKKVNGRRVQARILDFRNLPVTGWEWRPISTVQKGKWDGELARVPVGGPYRIDLRLDQEETAISFSDLLIGDLWVLAGQSNMEGVGDLVDVSPPSPLVHSFDMADEWVLAEEPLHTLVSAADPVHWTVNSEQTPERWTGDRLEKYIRNRRKGAGLGLPFALEMLKRTGIPIGLIPVAHGGTSMEQWSPALKDQGGNSLYGSMLRRFRASGGVVKGVLWYQGESDANPQAAPKFAERFRELVDNIRTDFNDRQLPFYYVQIARFVNPANPPEWNQVQLAQLAADSGLPRFGMVAAVDLSLDDVIHVSTPDLKRLGARLSNLACHDLFPTRDSCGGLKRGPRPQPPEISPGMLRVPFAEVNGSLRSDGRVEGFSIHAADGHELPMIYKARIDPADPSAIQLMIQGVAPAGSKLWYGFGKDPICNLRDDADMAVPVFAFDLNGPLPGA